MRSSPISKVTIQPDYSLLHKTATPHFQLINVTFTKNNHNQMDQRKTTYFVLSTSVQTGHTMSVGPQVTSRLGKMH